MALTVRSGRWCLARILEPRPGEFTTAAIQQAEAAGVSVEAYYPPLNAARTGYVIPFALCRFPDDTQVLPAFTNNVRLLPPRALSLTLAELTLQQRTTLRTQLEEWLTAYTFRDWDGVDKQVAAFSGAGFTGSTTLREVLVAIYGHLSHSDARPRPIVFESHNTEYLDPFTTDPYSAPRWVNRIQTAAWDSGDSSLDVSHVGSATLLEYTANAPGSIEHESQVTTTSAAGENTVVGVACRIDGATSDFYSFSGDRANSFVRFHKRVGGSLTTLQSTAQSITATNFVSFRIAAAGAAGANVVLSGWFTDSGGTSKPSDPGWLGVDGSPGFTYTDTAADRLDDSVHDACGIGGPPALNSDYDTRLCWWKSRAISDRTGGGTSVTGTTIASGSALTAPTVEHAVSLPTIASAAALFAATVAYAVSGATIASGSALTAPTMAYAVAGATIAAGSALTAPSVAYGVNGATIASASALSPPTISGGVTTISGDTIASGSAVTAPTFAVGAVTITGDTIASTVALTAPSAAYAVVTATIASGAALTAPTVAAGATTVTLSTIASGLVLRAPVVTDGSLIPGVGTTVLSTDAATATLTTDAATASLSLDAATATVFDSNLSE